MSTITKQKSNRVHTSTKLTPIQASLKKKERFIYQKFFDKWKKIKPKFQVNDLVRAADLKKTISKSDTTNYSHKLYEIKKNNNDRIPSFRLDHLPETFNEASLKQTELTLKENKDVMKALNLN